LESLTLLKSLQLKPNNQTFLVQEEIIPDPNTSFGTTKSNYLPLKEKFLKGEQKTLRKIKESEEKKLNEEEIKHNKLSILNALMNWGEWTMEDDYLYDFNYSLTDWVKAEVITSWQADILLTCGFKTIPKYNFFELLIFCVEKFTETSWAEFLSGNEILVEEFTEYTNSLKNPEITINKEIWERFVSSQSKEQREIVQQLNLKELIEEQINQRLGNWKPAEISEEKPQETTAEEKEQSQSTSSRYDDLFANLNKEEAERKRKKLEREEAQKKLEEQERKRREERLSEKDRKLKEDEERRAKERELAEQEEQKRREAEAARAESLQKEQEALFNKKMANIEEAKRRAEENLANQKKQNEIQEQKRKDEIEKMKKENEEEQKRLIQQAKDIEKKKQEELEAIALEDKEERQKIEKRANEEKAKIQRELDEKKRKNDEELKKKENALLKEKQEKQLEEDKIRREIQIQETLARELREAGRRQEELLKGRKNKQQALREFREQMYNVCLDYPWNSEEAKDGTRNPQQTSGGNLRGWLNSYPSMEFNMHRGDIYSGNWSGWPMAMKTFARAVGNRFVNKEQLRRCIDEYAQDLNCLD